MPKKPAPPVCRGITKDADAKEVQRYWYGVGWLAFVGVILIIAIIINL